MQTFHGAWPALLTPYTTNDKINYETLSSLVDFHLEKQVSGFYLCGSTGEGLFQNLDERRSIAEVVIDRVAGRVPVIIHVGASAINDAVALAAHAGTIGAAGISSILPPTCYNPHGVAPYLMRIAETVPDLPFLPYLFGGTLNSIALMHDLARVANFAGTKYFGPNMYEMSQIVAFRASAWTVFSGMDEQALPGLMYGAHGVIGSSLNFMPHVFRDIYRYARLGEYKAALALQIRANELIQQMMSYGYVGSMRAIMAFLGFDCGKPRLPNSALNDEQHAQFMKQFVALGFDSLVAPL